ncbi:MAG: cupin domain-containing protein [Thermomicrobia bacterium]|nr:cupin domain-containing protein [Thermomicrobia bacterium]
MAMTIATEIGCSCVLPEGGEMIRIFDEEIIVKVDGAKTGGAYAILVGSVAPGGGPPLHAHPTSESCYILSGEFEVTQRDADGVSTFRAGPGTIVNAPGGVPHRFENVSPTRSTMLIVVPPESVDFLRELGAAFPPGAQPDMEKMLDIHERYAIETFQGEEGSRPEPPKEGATSERARALAWRFQHANEALIATIEGCTPQQWRAVCADTGWTVGVQAHHIAVNEAGIADVAKGVGAGHPHPPLPPGMLDEMNARHAEKFANVSKEETVALLRENGPLAADVYRHLSEAQLALTTTLAEGYTVSVADLIERHGAEIRSALSP